MTSAADNTRLYNLTWDICPLKGYPPEPYCPIFNPSPVLLDAMVPLLVLVASETPLIYQALALVALLTNVALYQVPVLIEVTVANELIKYPPELATAHQAFKYPP